MLRIATFNVENLTDADFPGGQPGEKATAIAGVIAALKPHAMLVNEIESDQDAGESALGRTAGALAAAVSARGWAMKAFVWPVNTGVHSGMDLDNNGINDRAGSGRDYGGDCLGYGEFPGQYGMALLVHESVEVVTESVRTFQGLRWNAVPGALLPAFDGAGAGAWYSDEELAALPLSSKSHWDVPARFPDGRTIHLLASHPTPPVFDGPEDRNGRRNHDEIRFWNDYLATGKYVVDDAGRRGPLKAGAHFVILGDLNADPARGDSLGNPIGKWLLENPRVQREPTPRSVTVFRALEPDMTAVWKMRVDYALPSVGLEVVGAGVWRGPLDTPPSAGTGGAVAGGALDPFPSDHFPVWIEVRAAGSEPPAE